VSPLRCLRLRRVRLSLSVTTLRRVRLSQSVTEFKAFVLERIILFVPLHICIADTIAILLHDDCALHDSPPTTLLYDIYHTKLVLAISCKGQAVVRGRGKQQPICRDKCVPSTAHDLVGESMGTKPLI